LVVRSKTGSAVSPKYGKVVFDASLGAAHYAEIASMDRLESFLEGRLLFRITDAAGTMNDVMNVDGLTKDAEILAAGAGLVLKTPDGTKRYRITVNNAGAVTSTLI
jgi:hypothetical protein